MFPQSKDHVADLWADYFDNPSQWWDIRKNKTNPKAPDFRHKVTKDRLWIDNKFNPNWVQSRLFSECIDQGHKKGVIPESNNEDDEETRASLLEKLSSDRESVPSIDTIATLLIKCTKQRNPILSFCLHDHLHNMGLEVHASLGNFLVSLLIEVERIQEAQQIFNKLLHRNELSWNSLIKAYVKRGEMHQALNLYRGMRPDDHVHLSAYSYMAVFKACAALKDSKIGCDVHAVMASKGLFETNIFIGSSLINMYAQCGLLEKAREVFDKLPVRDRVSWNTLITGYVENECGIDACEAFELMKLEGISPDSVTFVGILKACGMMGAIEKVDELRRQIEMSDLKDCISVHTTLVDMYARHGLLEKAQQVFDNFESRNVEMWTALIAGYAEHGHNLNALDCFDKMQFEGISPDSLAFIYCSKACGNLGDSKMALKLHAEVCRLCLDRDVWVGSSLVDMYAKCGLLVEAQDVFNKLPERNIITWNALISGYINHGLPDTVIVCFEQMIVDNVLPDAVTFIYLLKAHGILGATEKGKEIHMEIMKKGLEEDVIVGSALVELYCKTGLLKQACLVFEKLPLRGNVAWNTLVAGYVQLGECVNAFDTVEKMNREGEKPSQITFQNLLNVCSHAGLLNEVQILLDVMSKDHGIIPDLEHYTCVIDALCRAGQIYSAITMIKDMPFPADRVVWHSILGGCRKWSELQLGKRAFGYVMQLDEKDATAYISMHNIFADNMIY